MSFLFVFVVLIVFAAFLFRFVYVCVFVVFAVSVVFNFHLSNIVMVTDPILGMLCFCRVGCLSAPFRIVFVEDGRECQAVLLAPPSTTTTATTTTSQQ